MSDLSKEIKALDEYLSDTNYIINSLIRAGESTAQRKRQTRMYLATKDELLERIYLDYFNNFITVDRFAEYYDITKERAKFFIARGKNINYKR